MIDTFKDDDSQIIRGCTTYLNNDILVTIASWLFDLSEAADNIILDTIYHELAHVIVGYEADHDELWKQVFLTL